MSDHTALRALLFETLQGLKSKTMDIDRAKAINETAQTIINCAKVETDYMRVSGQTISSGFISMKTSANEELGSGGHERGDLTRTGIKSVSVVPGGSITAHRMR